MENYIQQKAEKIVSALYLISDFIKDNDVVKWEIREEGISFMSNIILLKKSLSFDYDHAQHLITSSSEKLISFLNIASTSSIISKMNAEIVIHEIKSLIDFIEKNNLNESRKSGYILSDSFFATDNEFKIDKGQSQASETSKVLKDKVILEKENIKDNKNKRQENILNLLKKDSNLNIKDFAKVITDCSEKTIQRELTLLVEKGVVKKVGERRWSTYSLNSSN